ncbi:hypothetical protein [Agreia sp. COWG]|uniref:hypothetical protein n=1 Tax=Agreia sp. COWG TaxID=2773266 RepID=UPI0019260D41|nr:hypothetical protein [Agreia sp. COWG]CAD5989219.1 conserved protein of unknown function [Agreia sp. COWG]
MTNTFDKGYEPTSDNNNNSGAGAADSDFGAPDASSGREPRAGRDFGFGRGRGGFPFGGPGFGPFGGPFGGPGFGGHGLSGRGGHFGPRGFRGGKGFGGHLGGHLGEVVLAERFARGEIDAAEYRERITVLREVRDEGRAAHEAACEARGDNRRPSDA